MALVIFDLDDTLISRSKAIRAWAELLTGKEQLHPYAADIIVTLDQNGNIDRRSFLDAVHRLPGMRMSRNDLQEWYALTYVSCYEREHESINALELLRSKDWKIGIATNGSPARTHLKLERAGLASLIDALCIGEEIGFRKPSITIFEEVARRCNVELSGWMIGDAPLEDIWAGAAAGLHTAWLRNGQSWPALDWTPDIQANSITEAVDQILLTSSEH
ncbi:HAD family hydrolase [Nocardia abscessus]|uniref:HAD family hydrolase n=1 Tax=Nocardia abscessus TaxID=120957 RepID=UPI000A039B32|nr:HAD family hydrolase [Nocardia abscessus]MCC3328330.1 HAD family hydrolase [Nocardia abscessus]